MVSCLEPYDVNVSDYKDLLVVDALLTDEVKNHQVILTRSVSNLDEEPQVESGALVTIVDENNTEEVLTEIEPGVYETDKLQFVAKEGSTYTLKIRTAKGVHYASAPSTILGRTSIDKVHYKAGKEWNSDETEELDGLSILVDGNAYKGGYIRWLYDEDWKFKIPFPVRVTYNYTTGTWDYIRVQNDLCWKQSSSNHIMIHSFESQSNAVIKNKPVCFVPSEVTDKLTVRYSILVKQLSISKDEFEFWSKLKISSENVGDVFGTQPFSIVGNIKNVNDSKEPVLGYFQTGSVSSKRIYIDRITVADMNLPLIEYDHGCKVDSFVADGLSYISPLEIYEKKVVPGSYSLHDLIYNDMGMGVIGLLLTRHECADCRITGSDQKPDFWED